MKKVLGSFAVVVLVSVLALSIGCRKRQPEVAQQPAQPQANQMQPNAGGQNIAPAPSTLIVSDEVKKTWKSVKLSLIDKATNKSTVFVAPIGKETTAPGTELKVYVEAFLPAFKMENQTITSMSVDQTSNPATKIKVTEKGQEVFKGWLFELYPTVHPFNHPKYSIALTGYEKNK